MDKAGIIEKFAENFELLSANKTWNTAYNLFGPWKSFPWEKHLSDNLWEPFWNVGDYTIYDDIFNCRKLTYCFQLAIPAFMTHHKVPTLRGVTIIDHKSWCLATEWIYTLVYSYCCNNTVRIFVTQSKESNISKCTVM